MPLEGRREISLGRLDTRRDLTFVDDTVDGFLRAGTTAGLDGETLQLGTGRAASIGELFDAACAALETRATAVVDPRRMRPDASEVLVLESDPSRAREKMGWTARVTLQEGLTRTAQWLKQHRTRYNVDYLHV